MRRPLENVADTIHTTIHHVAAKPRLDQLALECTQRQRTEFRRFSVAVQLTKRNQRRANVVQVATGLPVFIAVVLLGPSPVGQDNFCHGHPFGDVQRGQATVIGEPFRNEPIKFGPALLAAVLA